MTPYLPKHKLVVWMTTQLAYRPYMIFTFIPTGAWRISAPASRDLNLSFTFLPIPEALRQNRQKRFIHKLQNASGRFRRKQVFRSF